MKKRSKLNLNIKQGFAFCLKIKELPLRPLKWLIRIITFTEKGRKQQMARDITHEKYVQAINFFARKSTGNSINRLKLMKLIWLADRLHLLRYGQTVLDVSYSAMPHGPVPSEVYDLAKCPSTEYAKEFIGKSGLHGVSSKSDVDLKHFAKTELDAFDEIWRLFGNMDRYELRDLSHQYPEWVRHGDYVMKYNTSTSINMDDFFELPTDKNTKGFELFDMDEDQLEYSKYLYEQSVKWNDAMNELAVDRIRRRRQKATL